MNPSISIITVCLNSAKTIEQTLCSVLAQNYQPVEYIVIDGGSTDQTLAIIEKYRADISMLISEPDKGIYDAMNKGLCCATGEIVGLINADDIYADERVISKIAKPFSDPSIQACFGDLVYFFQDPENIIRYWRAGSFIPGLFAKGWNPPHPTFFVRRHVYQNYGLFNTDYPLGGDVELMMRFLEKHRIKSVYLPEVLVKMRLGGVSNRGIKNIIEQNKSILRAAKKLGIPISPLKFWFYKIINRFFQFIVRPRN